MVLQMSNLIFCRLKSKSVHSNDLLNCSFELKYLSRNIYHLHPDSNFRYLLKTDNMRQTFILTTVLLLILSNRIYSQVNLAQGLVACYLLDNTTLDTTTNHLDLISFGTPVGALDRFGILPGAFEFNSANPDYMTGGTSTLFAPLEFTLTAWVLLNDAFPDQKIAGRAGVGAGGYLMGVDSNLLDAEVWDVNFMHFRLKGGNIPSNSWTHLAISFKANDYLKIYINGQVIDSIPSNSTGSGEPSTIPFTVGGAPWQPTALNVNGSLDDIFLYNRVINSDELMALYSFITGTLNGIPTLNYSSIYPVPVNDGLLHIDFSNRVSGDVNVKLIDLMGKLLFSTRLSNPEKEHIDVSSFKKGLYSVIFENQGKIETHRMIIQ